MLRDKVIEIFVITDDFCIGFEEHIELFRLESGYIKHRNRKTSLCDSKLSLFRLNRTHVI